MNGDFPQQLQAGLVELGLPLSDGQQRQLLDYLALLTQWNRVYNLTAVRDPAQMLTHHIFDSLAVIVPLRRHTQGRPVHLLDVGSGGGLPGVVIAICQPEIAVTCVDSAAKKAAFIQQAAGALRLPNLIGRHARVESLTGPFDLIVSRAFASLADFTAASHGALGGAIQSDVPIEHSQQRRTGTSSSRRASPKPSLSRGGLGGDGVNCTGQPHPNLPIEGEGAHPALGEGVWLAMKGKQPDAEIAALPPSVAVFHVEQLAVPGLDAQRCLVWLRRQRLHYAEQDRH
jgi:16S rRNA (guanine527-N7)-methyltransferase